MEDYEGSEKYCPDTAYGKQAELSTKAHRAFSGHMLCCKDLLGHGAPASASDWCRSLLCLEKGPNVALLLCDKT